MPNLTPQPDQTIKTVAVCVVVALVILGLSTWYAAANPIRSDGLWCKDTSYGWCWWVR